MGPPYVNEGPEIIKHGSKTFLVYSASFCGTDDYALGMLTASSTADPMLPASWTKSTRPGFAQLPTSRAYGHGPQRLLQVEGRAGGLDYLPRQLQPRPKAAGNRRNPRMQKFSWNTDGTPDFGAPRAHRYRPAQALGRIAALPDFSTPA